MIGETYEATCQPTAIMCHSDSGAINSGCCSVARLAFTLLRLVCFVSLYLCLSVYIFNNFVYIDLFVICLWKCKIYHSFFVSLPHFSSFKTLISRSHTHSPLLPLQLQLHLYFHLHLCIHPSNFHFLPPTSKRKKKKILQADIRPPPHSLVPHSCFLCPTPMTCLLRSSFHYPPLPRFYQALPPPPQLPQAFSAIVPCPWPSLPLY